MSVTQKSYFTWSIAIFLGVLFSEVLYPGLNGYYQGILMVAGVNIMLATSLTLINGFTGQFSLGHAGFMAVGGYTCASLTIYLLPKLGLSPLGIGFFYAAALIAGGIVSGICGYLVGLPSLRLKGDYLAIVTLGFGEIIRVIFLNVDAIGGARGLTGIQNFTNQRWIVACTLICCFIMFRILGTNQGRGMQAVREDEVAAEAMGVNTTSTKVGAFVMSSFFAGVTGGLYAHYYGYLNPSTFGFMKSFEVIVIIVLGGLGSVSGSILAAIALTILPEALRPLQEITKVDFRMILYSLVLILFMLLKPNGLLGRHEISYYWKKFRRSKT